MKVVNKLFVVVALGALLLGFDGGCAASHDRLQPDHFAQIRPHASTAVEVEQTLGEPDQKLGDKWLYERPDKHLVVIVDFDQHGRVSRKQWIDAGAEHWQDSEDGTLRRALEESNIETNRP